MTTNRPYVDESFRCGDDFYKFATNKWIETHPQPKEYARWGVFTAMVDENNKRIQKLITKNTSSVIGAKINGIYKQYIDVKKREDDGIESLTTILDDITKISSVEEFVDKCASLDISPFWGVYDEPDQKNPTMMVTTLCQGGMSLGNKDYYLNNDDNTKKVVKAFKKFLIKSLVLLGYDRKVASKMFRDMFRIEKSIAKVAYSVEECQEPSLNYHPTTVAKLSKKYGLDLDNLLTKYGYEFCDDMNVSQEKAVAKGFSMLSKLPLASLNDYLICVMVGKFGDMLTTKLRKTAFEYNKAVNGTQKPMPIKKEAVNYVASMFREAIGELYAKKYFSKKDKKNVTALVSNLINEYKGIISEQEWMCEKTKSLAIEKLSAMTIKVGYPDTFVDYSDVPFDEKKKFFENYMAIRHFFRRKDIERHHNKPVDKTEWHMPPHAVNAYYSPSTNEICFPCAILQAPFYSSKQSDACNYGAIGAVIGHEMTHGFDNHGRQFDKDGNLKMWWNDDEIAKFEEYTKRTVEHYSSLDVLPDLKCNGTLTLGENLADYGGLKIAWRAFNNLKDSSLDDKKDFFISYATSWAGVASEEYLRQQTMNDEHPACHLRVNGCVAMFDPWYETFDIKEDDKLFIPKDKRAIIW